jgi:hypothetical protein
MLAVFVLSQTASYAQPFIQVGQAQPQPTQLAYLPVIIKDGAALPPTPTPTPTPAPPLAVRFSFDAGRAAHASIGPEGGMLSATAADGTQFQLTVPPDALDFTETITMTPAKGVTGLPLSGGMAGAVDLEPAGLALYEPAILRITPAAAPAGPIVVGFAFDQAGANFHLYPTTPPANTAAVPTSAASVTMGLNTIRPAGAGSGTQANIDDEMLVPLSDPTDALEQDLVISRMPATVARNYYTNILTPDLIRAASDDAILDQALREFNNWIFQVQMFRLTETYASEIAEAKAKLLKALRHGAAAAADRCYTRHRPEEAFTLLRLAHLARTYLPGAEAAAIEARLAKCLQFKLTFHSKVSMLTDGKGFIYELKAELTLRAANGTRATGTGTLHWVDIEWVGDTAPCSFIGAGSPSTFNAAGPQLGLSLAPVSRNSPAVNVSLRYDPGKPIETFVMQCPGGSVAQPPTTRWSNYFRSLHSYELDSSGVNAKVQIANVGSFTGWVYHHTGYGIVIEDTQIDIEHTPAR